MASAKLGNNSSKPACIYCTTCKQRPQLQAPALRLRTQRPLQPPTNLRDVDGVALQPLQAQQRVQRLVQVVAAVEAEDDERRVRHQRPALGAAHAARGAAIRAHTMQRQGIQVGAAACRRLSAASAAACGGAQAAAAQLAQLVQPPLRPQHLHAKQAHEGQRRVGRGAPGVHG